MQKGILQKLLNLDEFWNVRVSFDEIYSGINVQVTLSVGARDKPIVEGMSESIESLRDLRSAICAVPTSIKGILKVHKG